MPREFEIRRELELPASPEEVWDAVATAAGNAAWLFPSPPSEPVVSEPPHRLVVRQEDGDWFNAVAFVIEGREGGRTLLRYAHSGVFVDDWDTQYDAVNQHTDFYLHALGQYLEHFAGRTATYVGDVPGGVQAPEASAQPDGFERLQRALSLPEGAGEGDSVQLSPDGLEPIEGVIDHRRGPFLGIRTPDGLYRFFGRNAFGAPVGVAVHSFGNGIDAEQVKSAWRSWLDGVYG
jgi:uncharacterized protein YndB with AHSA1/START domain